LVDREDQRLRLRLLERLRNARQNKGSPDYNSEDLIASIERHLDIILNTHQGSAAAAPDFGMPDFVSLASQSDLDSLRELTRVLTEVIRKYEPRLQNPQISYLASKEESGVLDFSLSGIIELNNERRNLFFSTFINPDGRIVVTK
jgi:type VI secretion system protein